MAAEDGEVAAKRRRRCMGGGEDMMSALPEHVLQKVLSRVGTVKDLFMLAVTCRRWLGRFTDRAFLRDILCPGQVESLLGFFLQNARSRASSACSFLPAPGSPLSPRPTARALTSSLVADGGSAFNYAVPLAARRGIVLLQRVPRRRDTRIVLGVCNPVTGERHLLAPLLRSDSTQMCAYAIVTGGDADTDANGRFTFSQLLVATADMSEVVRVHSYSAATRSWSATPTLCRPVDGRHLQVAAGQSSAVVHQGAAHWLWLQRTGARDDDGSLYKLSVQLGGAAAAGTDMGFAFTKIPVRGGGFNPPLLCVTGDGNLAVICVYISHVAVNICRQQQQAGGGHAEKWERTAFTIPAVVPYPDIDPMWQPKEKWFHSRGGSILVLHRSSTVFIIDLHSKTVEKVVDCFLPLLADEMDRTAVPYEMDLVDFFMLKLGDLSSTGSSG